jgi:hypothetical protein
MTGIAGYASVSPGYRHGEAVKTVLSHSSPQRLSRITLWRGDTLAFPRCLRDIA